MQTAPQHTFSRTETSSFPLEELRKKALILAKEKQFTEAISLFRQILKQEPGDAPSWRNLGIVYSQSGRPVDAEKCYKKCAELVPNSVNAHLDLAKLRRKLKRYAQAVVASGRAVELDPTSAECCFEHAVTLAGDEQSELAISMYQRAIELRADYADAFNNLGALYQRMDRLDDAVRNLRTAIQLRPGNASGRNNLGVALAEQRKHEEALACYQQALAIDPKYALAWNNLGNSFRSLGRNAEAIAALERALALKPDYAETLWGQSPVL